jgi:hypothetical protein
MRVTDYFGKPVSWDGTAAEALLAGYNVNCIDCYQCTGCEDCIRCVDCYYCKDCADCVTCRYCVQCRSCTRCANSKGLTLCIDCRGCTRCYRCYNCNGCQDCDNCSQQPLAVMLTAEGQITVRADFTVKICGDDHFLGDWKKMQKGKVAGEAWNCWRRWQQVIEKITER